MKKKKKKVKLVTKQRGQTQTGNHQEGESCLLFQRSGFLSFSTKICPGLWLVCIYENQFSVAMSDSQSHLHRA